MSEKIIVLYQKYKKEYEKTGKNRHIVVRYGRELKRLGININKGKSINSNLKRKPLKNILMIVDSNLNFTAGNTIWGSNTINLFLKEGYKVELLTTNTQPLHNNFKRNVEKDIKIHQEVSVHNFLKNKWKEYDTIIIRHDSFISSLKNNESWIPKVILYIINEKVIPDGFKGKIWTQSNKLKEKILKRNIKNEQIEIKPPIGYKYNFKVPERKDNQIRLIYCGTLREEENILEIIEEFKKIHQEKPEVILKIIYGKIHGDQNFTNKINQIIKEGVEGITFKYNLSHRDSCYEIATSDIGICWRKNGWGDNGELSTKVKEYEIYGTEVKRENISNFL